MSDKFQLIKPPSKPGVQAIVIVSWVVLTIFIDNGGSGWVGAVK